MRVGYSVRDITPLPGLTLSGFAARRNQPSKGVDDPIEIHALALEADGVAVLLLVFDLLALGADLTARIRQSVCLALSDLTPPPAILVVCTHNHSAPATIRLIGCGIEDGGYHETLVAKSRQAAVDAFRSLRHASMRYSVTTIPGISYNRRRLLADGRVVMGLNPELPLVKSGPVWERFVMARFDALDGRRIAGLMNWAAHPCVVCTANISADYPGELRRLASQALGLPFMFIQGPGANINLPLGQMNRSEMLNSVERLMPRILQARWEDSPGQPRLAHRESRIRLLYSTRPSLQELQTIVDGMTAIITTGQAPKATLRTLANILNVERGAQPDPVMMRYIAQCVAEWGRETMERLTTAPDGIDVRLDVCRIGPLWFTFVAAEVFSETAFALQNCFPDELVNMIGYASPLVGYLPPDESLGEGGYEVEHAYRFYGHPASFAPGSEPSVRAELARMIGSIKEAGQ